MSGWNHIGGSTGKEKMKKEAWERLCATLSEIQPLENKNDRGDKKGGGGGRKKSIFPSPSAHFLSCFSFF